MSRGHVKMPYGGLPAPDVVDLLVEQHQRIRDLLAQVLARTGGARREAFDDLLRLLAVHETAEEEVLHPAARKVATGGQAVVGDRLAEEHDAKELLGHLDAMDVDDPDFLVLFSRLREAVITHALAEQRYEFNRVRQHVGAPRRAAMRLLVQAAESAAPTHPRAGVESAKANLLLGPPLAVMDRARDAIRHARAREDDVHG